MINRTAIEAARTCIIVVLCSLCQFWPATTALFDGDCFWPACVSCVGTAEVHCG